MIFSLGLVFAEMFWKIAASSLPQRHGVTGLRLHLTGAMDRGDCFWKNTGPCPMPSPAGLRPCKTDIRWTRWYLKRGFLLRSVLSALSGQKIIKSKLWASRNLGIGTLVCQDDGDWR
ncbi:hypothetical protein DFP73DRAFT_190351 [Morchella snyderi]|nr:hypothetical protein DFP73DRAFT_190351 [Morchella snyderi]